MAAINVLQTIHRNSDAFRQSVQIQPIGLLLHSTGVNNPNLGRYVDPSLHPDIGPNPFNNHWNMSTAQMGGRQVQVHGWIGRDRHGVVRAAQTLPFNIACWGSGAGRIGNSNFNPIARLQMELCEDNRQNRAYLLQCLDVWTSWAAMCCRQFNWDPLGTTRSGWSVILDHAQAHQLGVASNHADVMHWLRIHNITLDWVRQETRRKLDILNRPVAPPRPSNPPTRPSIAAANTPQYSVHVKNIGWLGWVANGIIAGTTGQARRIEAVAIFIANALNGSGVRYRVHSRNLGWLPWVANGTPTGTTGLGLRIEALEMELTGPLATTHDIEYRVHMKNLGWGPWVRNGVLAGTTGQSRRIEAIEIRLVPKR